MRCGAGKPRAEVSLVLERLEDVTGKRLDPIHIIGGGTKNRLLNQFTADARAAWCMTGPVEATAIGNVLMQAIGLGIWNRLHEARAVVRASFMPETVRAHGYCWLG